MCELFAMSSRSPTRVSLSLQRLAAGGAPSGSLADGWGVACYDGHDVRLMREPEPAGNSP
jgi:predicted glutamine amidotransferase